MIHEGEILYGVDRKVGQHGMIDSGSPPGPAALWPDGWRPFGSIHPETFNQLACTDFVMSTVLMGDVRVPQNRDTSGSPPPPPVWGIENPLFQELDARRSPATFAVGVDHLV